MKRHEPEKLLEHGLNLPDPAQVYVESDVCLDRLATEDVTLYPGVRLSGASTLIGPGAEVGADGAATLTDVALGPGARFSSGSADRCTLLAGAVAGPNAHLRAGTILEEQASTGHAVGLKQTVLSCYAAVGSNVNFCDCYLGGGRSRDDHSEVGSGFIHFNFTPFGARGDKATASLFGSVPKSVVLRGDRVFLGGAGGVVGPVEIGFGTVLAAGAVYRKSYGSNQLVVGESLKPRVVSMEPSQVPGLRRRLEATRHYVSQLEALKAWYEECRLARVETSMDRALMEHAVSRLTEGISERGRQARRLIAGAAIVEGSADSDAVEAWDRWTAARPENSEGSSESRPAAPPWIASEPALSAVDYLGWLHSLSDEQAASISDWMEAVVQHHLTG